MRRTEASKLRVLIVEDQPLEAELMARALGKGGYNPVWTRVDTEADYQAALDAAPDIILSDYQMPQFSGPRALALLKQRGLDIPFILVTGTIGEEHAAEVIRLGADDYLLKDRLGRLSAAVGRSLREVAERVARKKVDDELEALREQLKSIVSSLPDVVWSAAYPSNRMLYISDAAATVFGWTPQNFYEERAVWRELIHPEDRPRMMATWEEAAQSERYESEYRIVKPTGEVRWIQSRGRRVSDASGRVLRIDGIARDVTEQREQEQRIAYLAHYDPLTALPNRVLFLERLTQLLDAAKRAGSQVAVAAGDIRRFRLINETFGRQAGDALLQHFAERLRSSWPEPENVARLASDSFAGILTGVAEPRALAYTAEKTIAAALATPFPVEGREIGIAFAAGIAVFPADGQDADALLRNAEAALKQAKASGEHCLFYRREMNSRLAEALLLENKLRQAIEREEFILHYQPKFHGTSGRLAGLEALIRWREPDAGLLPPDKFIPMLEETGMILDVGSWAIRKALAAYREWYIQGLQPPRIAVNVSAIQLRQKDFVEVVRSMVRDSVAGSHGLDFEITESLLMEDIEGNIEKLRAVRGMGVNIAIDDFGTGYSSLRYLTKLPVNTVKIDRSFIATMATEPDSMTIVSTIISLAHGLKLKVVAEGVESEAQLQLLRLLNCDEMQGYLFSKPLPADRVEDFLKSAMKANGAVTQ